MTDKSRREQLNAAILESMSELMGTVIKHADQLAQKVGVPGPFLKAMHIMDGPIAMKELGKHMHCDPSFVTLLTDMLEKRGLARREPHAADRRVKNVVLTDEGLQVKHELEAEIAARVPWNYLTDDESEQFLALLRKMLRGAGELGSNSAQDADDPTTFFAGTGFTPTDALEAVLASGAEGAAAHSTHGSPPSDGGGE